MNITLICKGGVNTGLGHLHRTISFLHEAENFADFTVIAIIDRGLELLFKEVIQPVFIYNENDLAKALECLKNSAESCIIDCVELNSDNQILLRSKFKKIISLSPVFNNYEIIDVLFTRFTESVYPSNVKVFSGLEYSIFNNNCQQISDYDYNKSIHDKSLTIAISMGGVDAPNKTLRILESIALLEIDLTIWILLGEGYSYSYQDLVDTIGRDSNHEIVLAKSNRSMWKILSNCSLAIFAGGLTTFEAIYAGLPTINIFEKEIHKSIISKEILEKNVSLNLGVLNDATLETLKQKLNFFYNDRNELLIMRENTKGLLDKKGVQRTIQQILALN
jgi:spore coat polysaccharide biosynthesis predicted glycosyltransferase SpsG